MFAFILVMALPLAAQRGKLRVTRLSLEEGLSQSTVDCILQDRTGFMWFGTQDGLNRYDGYHFKVYQHDPEDETSISNNAIICLYEDRSGNLWVGTPGGLNRFDHESETFVRYHHDPARQDSLSSDNIKSVLEDASGHLWVGTSSGLNRFDHATGRARHYRHDPSNPNSLSDDNVKSLYEDGAKNLWIGTGKGLNELNRQNETFTHYFHNPDDPFSISHNGVLSICQDRSGVLWIGTNAGGLNRFDRERRTFTRYKADARLDDSLSHDQIKTVYADRSGRLWIGTMDGLNRFEGGDRFSHYVADPFDSHSLSVNEIRSIFEDRSGVLWIGTAAGGINKIDHQRDRFTHYKIKSSRSESSSIFAIFPNRDGLLWLGTSEGLVKFNRNTDATELFRSDPISSNSLDDTNVWSILEDASGTLWVGTDGGLKKFEPSTGKLINVPLAGTEKAGDIDILVLYEDRIGKLWLGTFALGLVRYDRENNQFKVYQHIPGQKHSLSSNDVRSIKEDRDGTLWIGTKGGGLNRFDRGREQFSAYRANPEDPTSISNDMIRSIYEPPGNDTILWLGTSGGLNRLTKETGTFKSYRKKDGLPNDLIYGILGDRRGFLWVSTNRGLSRFDPSGETFRNYDINDGLQSNEFNTGAYYQSRTGELFFGGIDGINAFFPKQIKDDSYVPKVILTNLMLFNKPVSIRSKKNQKNGTYLEKAIHLTDSIEMSYKDYVFSFEFTSLHYAAPERNLYAYKLEGLDKDWLYTEAENRRATFTNLAAGDYVFRVKGSNKDGVWNEVGTAIKLKINSPPWKTWWAKSLYFFFTLSLIFWYLRLQKEKLARERQIAEQERRVAEKDRLIAEQERLTSSRLRQLDKLKDEFLANTSHELRTPLNGIIGLAESLRDGVTGPLPPRTNHNLSMIVSSGKRLAGLVNDLLDFAKLKNEGLVLRRAAVDLHSLVDVVLTLSKPLVGAKNLQLLNAIPDDLYPADADENRLQQIFHNLIGNAVKFTDHGYVKVFAEQQGEQLHIQVSDTGIGIPAEHFDRIFESFEQADASTARVYGGTGLGLAVTKKIVELHGGSIDVESTVGEGSTFSFSLPVHQRELQPLPKPHSRPKTRAVPITSTENLQMLPTGDERDDKVQLPEGEFNIMIVDDEPVNRQVLLNLLSLKNYNLIEVSGGQEALESLDQYPCDLILLDIMMPRMTGYETCQKIREQYSVHELPIIFLTARDRPADLVEGFSSGANDYLTKPVEKGELFSRVGTHLKLLKLNRGLESLVTQRTQELVEAQKELVEAAHTAGMAEIAGNVLHNVGNTLNSVKTSVQLVRDTVVDTKPLFLFEKVVGLFREHQQNLCQFFEEDPRSAKIPFTLERILSGWAKQSRRLVDESGRLVDYLEHMVNVLQEQQSHVQIEKRMAEPVDINQLIRNTVLMEEYLLKEKRVEINEDFQPLPMIEIEKSKFMRILFCLLKNSCEAISEQGTNHPGQITFQTRLEDENAIIRIIDNGNGIPEEHAQKVFAHGFTTKASNHGFGLHYCANAMNEMSGSIKIEKPEAGEGTRLKLIFPIHAEEKKSRAKS